MSAFYLVCAVLGTTVLALGLGAGAFKRFLWTSEPMLATAVGVMVGPHGFGLFNPATLGHEGVILEQLARLTLAISLIGVAFRLPDTWVRRQWRDLFVILVIGMPLMWLVSGLCAWSILGLPLLPALLLGAVITPTDPVVASSIVTGELADDVDTGTRHLISAESGANDGLAFLLVMLPALLLRMPLPAAMLHWTAVVLLGKIMGSTFAGVAIGYLAAQAVVTLHQWKHTDHRSLLAVTVALALAILGITDLLGGDGILAVFAAGLAFNWIFREERGHPVADHQRIQATIKQFLDVPVFVFFGMVVPIDHWLTLGWPLWVFIIAVLLFRRLPVLVLLYPLLPILKSSRDALFVGWFGPIAVAAMVYASWADVHAGQGRLWIIASFVIFVSIFVHGVTATPLTQLYARARRRDSAATPQSGADRRRHNPTRS